MQVKRMLFLCVVLALGLTPMFAANVVYSLSGNTGAVISGTDCFGAANQNGDMVSATIKSTASPTKTTATTATYNIPKGGVTGTIVTALGPASFTSTSVWKMTVYHVANPWLKFTGAGPDGSITANAYVPKGSITAAWLKHPKGFTKSETLTSKSNVEYTGCGGTTKIGINSGTIN